MKKLTPGNFVRIPLGEEGFAFGRIIENPLVAFYDFLSPIPDVSLEEIARKPVAFSIWVYNNAIGRKGWKVIGNLPLEPHLDKEYHFYKKDPITGRLSLYTDSRDIPATYEDVRSCERAAVWQGYNVEQRLLDHFNGLPNEIVEGFKRQVEECRIPESSGK